MDANNLSERNMALAREAAHEITWKGFQDGISEKEVYNRILDAINRATAGYAEELDKCRHLAEKLGAPNVVSELGMLWGKLSASNAQVAELQDKLVACRSLEIYNSRIASSGGITMEDAAREARSEMNNDV